MQSRRRSAAARRSASHRTTRGSARPARPPRRCGLLCRRSTRRECHSGLWRAGLGGAPVLRGSLRATDLLFGADAHRAVVGSHAVMTTCSPMRNEVISSGGVRCRTDGWSFAQCACRDRGAVHRGDGVPRPGVTLSNRACRDRGGALPEQWRTETFGRCVGVWRAATAGRCVGVMKSRDRCAGALGQ